MSSAYEHGIQAEVDRRADLERAALTAEWEGATGAYAGVIRQLRFRGNEAALRAKWILRGLLLVIALGLGFYLGLPYWERFVDGTRDALERQQAVHLQEQADLDGQRRALIEGTAGSPGLLRLLEATATPIPSGVEGRLRDAIVNGETILLFGDDGAITRSVNGGQDFTPVDSGVDGDLWDAIVDGETILVFGGGGAITRSVNGGQDFTPVPSGVEGFLTDAVVDGETILLFGESGAITRSVNGGRDFTPVPSGVEGVLLDAIVDGETILLFGGGGAITRSVNRGQSFTPVLSGVTASLEDAIVDGETILLFGANHFGIEGEMTRSVNGGESFTPVSYGVGAALTDALVDGATMLLFGDRGAITRSVNGGQDFAPVPSGVEGVLLDAIVDGETILLFGGNRSFAGGAFTSQNGLITRSVNGGQDFTPVPSGVEGVLLDAIVDGETILLFGEGGAITRSVNGGESFTPLPSGVRRFLRGAVSDEGSALLYGSGGTLVWIDNRWGRVLEALEIADGTQGDTALANFLDQDLPEHIRTWPPVVDMRRALSLIEARRSVVDGLQGETTDQLENLIEAPALFRREEVRETFVGYLALCRGEDASAEMTQACLAGWQAQQDAEGEDWWQTLAVQVPPGVLLLFLLATLGGLYRYTLRMAGFSHSRADALELLQAGVAPEQQKALSALATDLASDKVEFGKGNTPTDQAVELAKAIAGKS